jgi:hypothetical protein
MSAGTTVDMLSNTNTTVELSEKEKKKRDRDQCIGLIVFYGLYIVGAIVLVWL